MSQVRTPQRVGSCQLAALALVAFVPATLAAQPVTASSHVHTFGEPAAFEIPAEEATRIPGNLVVPGVLQPLVTSMLRQSPTFRRQCARLAAHSSALVQLELTRPLRGTSGARSLATWNETHLRARVQLDMRKPWMFVELIAHELEHVLEQLDGCDLGRLGRQRVHGVMGDTHAFETARSQTQGRTVAREMRE